jgi:hypothetical protein
MSISRQNFQAIGHKIEQEFFICHMETIAMKRCAKCNKEKHEQEFGKDSKRNDGLRCYCRHCTSIIDKEWRASNPEKYKKMFTEGKKRMTQKYPMKRKARTAVNNAVRDGIIPKVGTLQCVECDTVAEQYHHHNGYDKQHWLDVIPVCRGCHKD